MKKTRMKKIKMDEADREKIGESFPQNPCQVKTKKVRMKEIYNE